MSAQLDFVLGTATIVLPQYQIPLLVGAVAVKGVRALCNRRKNKNSAKVASNGNDGPSDSDGNVTLAWKNITCTLTDKHGKTRKLLDGISGSARPGRLTAIMGPSGSGKTTLLNTLAGQLPRAKRMRLTGSITLNGVPQAQAAHQQGFVQQEDLFYSMLTVRETLTMAAKLGQPKGAEGDMDAYIEALIRKLGLTKAADSVVGDARQRGLSGGEKKRLSIGCELISSPKLVFADEPTTGLDSFQAEKVMQTLKDLTQEGHTVVASIHQPRSSIFGMFDDLVLLSDGAVVYHGETSGVLDHFAALGHPCPDHFNPAEFLADLISVDTSSPEAESISRARVTKLLAAYKQNGNAGGESSSNGKPEPPRPAATATAVSGGGAVGPKTPLHKQLGLLLQRSWRQVTRDKATNVSRAMVQISSALIFGSIFWRLKRTQTGIQDRLGLLQVAAINTAMSSLIKTLGVFPIERTIVSRERSKGEYGVLPYFGSKLVAELPVGAAFPLCFAAMVYPACGLNGSLTRFAKFLGILTLESFTSASLGLAVGAIAPTPQAAVAIGPALMTVFIVFGGYYVNSETVPRPLRWIPKTSLIKHSFEALAVNEFSGLDFELEGRPTDVATGDQALARVGFGKSTIAKAALKEARVLLFWYWITYCILQYRRPKFQTLEAPEKEAE